MSRWDFKVENVGDEYQAIATPDFEEMSKFTLKASRELTRKIMQAEEELVLQCLASATLKRMIKLCENELERRDRGAS